MSLSSALVEDDWLKPLVEDLGLSGEEELKWDDLAFLDLATPASKSKYVSQEPFGGDSACLFDGDYYLKEPVGSAGALLDLFPSSSPEREERSAENLLLEELIASPANSREEDPPAVVDNGAHKTDKVITLGDIQTLPQDAVPKDALAKISITRNANQKTTTISVLTPDGSSGHSYQVNTLNVLEAIEALKPLNLDKLILSGGGKEEEAAISANRIDLDVNDSSPQFPVEKVVDASTAAFIADFASRGISISSLYRVVSSPRYWICPYADCKKGFSKLSLLKVHLFEHYGIRPYACPVPGCKWSFKTPFKLKRHAKTHYKESSKKRFVCNLCSTGFSTSRNLGAHLKSHEPSESISPRNILLHERGNKLDNNFLYEL